MQTIVLSGSRRETIAWAVAQERPVRSVVHVVNSSSIAGRAYDKIVELPSFEQRRDRFAIKNAIRSLRRRNPNVQYETQPDWVMPAPAVRPSRNPVDYLFGDVPEITEDDKAEITLLAPEDEKFDQGGTLPPGPTEITNDTGKDEVVQPAPATQERPKKKGRRTNEQKAFDEAKAAHDAEPTAATLSALSVATNALKARHPDDERLSFGQPDDLDF